MQEPTLRAPLVAYFTAAEQELASVLEQAQQEGTLREGIKPTELAATLVAVVQGGYVLARAFQDPEQMRQAIRGALSLIDGIERR